MQGHLRLQSSVQLWCSFYHQKFSFCGALFKRILAWKWDISKKCFLEWRMKLFLSLQSFTCHIVNIRVWKYVLTSAVIKIKTFHSCRTCVVCVALVLHSCHTCIALALLVLHSCCIRVARVALVSLVSGIRFIN